MKNMYDNPITKDLYELPIEFKFTNHNDVRTSPTLSNTKSNDYNYNIFSPIRSPRAEKELPSWPNKPDEIVKGIESEVLREAQARTGYKSSAGTEFRTKPSPKAILNGYTEYILKKRNAITPIGQPDVTDSPSNAKANFRKQIGRVKYYWRGTNFNYPFTFMKIHNLRVGEDSKGSIYSDGSEELIICVEDLSKKKINPTEFFYR